MNVLPHPAALVATLEAAEGTDIVRPDPALAVWDIRAPPLFTRGRADRWKRVRQCRAALFQCFKTLSPRHIQHQDAPGDFEVPGEWRRTAAGAWACPDTFNPDERATASWLALGGWTLCLGQMGHNAYWIDLLRSTGAACVNWMQVVRVSLFIASELDDVEWRVGIDARPDDRG
jgi:hypothetical protein